MIVIAESILGSLASPHFKSLTNYGDKWGIEHVSYDGESVAGFSENDFDTLIERWIDLEKQIETYQQDREAVVETVRS